MAERVVLATTAMTRGGVWRHIEDLAVALRDDGHEVTIALPRQAVKLHGAASAAGLGWQRLGLALHSDGIWHQHLHNTYDRRALALLVLRRGRGPTVLTEHLPRSNASDERLEPDDPRTPGARAAKTAFKRFEYGLVRRVIAVSTGSAEFIRARYGLAAEKLTCVHNGVRQPQPAPVARALGPRVVTVASLIRQKGIDVVIDAAHRSREVWSLTIAGSGAQRAMLEARAAAGPAAGRIELTGWVDTPARLLEQASVVCLPSRWESFPYVALEAAALGRAVVAARVDGVDEIVREGVSGILVDRDDPGALAAALDRVAVDPALAGAYGAAAAERARAFTIEQMREQTLRVYRGLG